MFARQDFYRHHIKTGGDVNQFLLFEIGERDLGKLSLFPGIHGFGRWPIIPIGTGFHFYKNKRVMILGNDVDLAGCTLVIPFRILYCNIRR